MIRTLQTMILATAVALTVPMAVAADSGQADADMTRMATQIQKRILRLNNYGVFDNLSFGIAEDGTVVLRGQASRPTLKKSAERVTKRVEGVKDVVNEIEVLPHSRMDDDLRRMVYVNIYGHPTLSRYDPNRGGFLSTERLRGAGFGDSWFAPPLTVAQAAGGITNDPPMGRHPIHIVVKNGIVELTGVVDTSGDKAIAEMQANGTKGVHQVVNNLVAASELNAGAAAD